MTCNGRFESIQHSTGAPKLIRPNSDLFLEKRATVGLPIKSFYMYFSTFPHKQIIMNQFWGTCEHSIFKIKLFKIILLTFHVYKSLATL